MFDLKSNELLEYIFILITIIIINNRKLLYIITIFVILEVKTFIIVMNFFKS